MKLPRAKHVLLVVKDSHAPVLVLQRRFLLELGRLVLHLVDYQAKLGRGHLGHGVPHISTVAPFWELQNHHGGGGLCVPELQGLAPAPRGP